MAWKRSPRPAGWDLPPAAGKSSPVSPISLAAARPRPRQRQVGALIRKPSRQLAGPGARDRFRRATLAVIKAEQLADRITVVTCGGTVLYDDELAEGGWSR
ncbi:hypothetical protein ACFY4K_34785 [Streptomyces leeuwenhoekii]|uniref:hypothetical protein n=1 Tax=Streptomyces leeuwenhoekii TaxID=1437453 RepID=UPI00368309A3